MSSVALQVGRQQIGGGHPSLDLNFVAGAWPPGLSFSRASGATVNCWARYDQRAPNGGFFGGSSDWLAGGAAGLSFAGNTVTATHTGSTYAGVFTSASTLEAGKVYRITVDITANSAGRTVQIAHQGVAGLASINSTGLLQATYRPATTGRLAIEFTTDALIGNSFTASTLMLEELTLWQPGMDWLGPELVTNGAFSDGLTGWSNASIGTGTVVLSGGGAAITRVNNSNKGILVQSQPAAPGRTYQLTGTASNNFGFFGFGGAAALVTPGAFSVTVTAISQQGVDLESNTDGETVVYDNISVREQLYTLQTVLLPANIPRIAYDPVTGACLGAMVEPQRTNLLSASQMNAGWANNAGCSASVATVLAPDGSFSATRMTCNSGGTNNRHYGQAVVAGTTYCYSLHVKSGVGGIFQCAIIYGASGSFRAWLNTTTGAISGAVLAGVWTGGSAAASQAANGWWRFSLTATVVTDTAVTVETDQSQTSGGYSVAPGEYFNCWGSQLEAGTEPTSYIPTAGAAATRAADSCTLALPAGLPLPHTTVIEYDSVAASSEQGLYGYVGGEILKLNRLGDAIRAVRPFVGTRGSLSLPTGAGQGPAKAAMTVFADGTGLLSANGLAAVTTLDGATSSASLLIVGSDEVSGGAPINGHVRRLRVYRRTMTPAELQAVTK